jgi:hypothetical protein
MMTLHETQPMTPDEAAQILAILLDSGRGNVSDDGTPRRPWVYVNLATAEEADELRDAFGRGFAKTTERGGRFGAWGNEALEVFEYLLGAGLNGNRGARARRLLERYGDDGRPWRTELERLRAGG